jgi:site-specific recombinase XerD
MDLEALQNIDKDKLEKLLQIAAILGDGQVCSNAVITLERGVNEYLSFVSHNRAPKTLEGVKLVCKYLLEYFPANRDLRTIMLRDCECFLDTLKKNAPKAVYNYCKTARTMWNKLIKWNYVSSNPFEQVELPKRQNLRAAHLTEEMLYKIMPFIENEVIRDMVAVTFYTGLRRGEVVNITWQDVNLKKDLLTIGNENFKTKTRKQRVIPIHPKVKEILLRNGKSQMSKVKRNEADGCEINLVQLPDKKRYVFCKSSGYCFTADYLSKQFKKASRKAGIDEAIHFHSIRHGSITGMILKGANVPSVQRIAGHANIQTTMAYTHVGMDDMRDAVGLL